MSADIVVMGLKAVSAFAQVKQARSTSKQMQIQAEMQEVQADRKAIQNEQAANELMRQRRQQNSMLIANAAAGGVDPFSGSALTIKVENDTNFGKDYRNLLRDAFATKRAGQFQASVTRQAAAVTKQTGYFQAANSIGEGVYAFQQMQPPKYPSFPYLESES
jgi:pyridoxal biosynthesis lyase PdxS